MAVGRECVEQGFAGCSTLIMQKPQYIVADLWSDFRCVVNRLQKRCKRGVFGFCNDCKFGLIDAGFAKVGESCPVLSGNNK